MRKHLSCLGIMVAFVMALSVIAARADVIQIDVKDALNTDVIVKFYDGKLHSSNQCDHEGLAFITQTAAESVQKDSPKGLPDDGHFAANDRHPEVQLHYKNSEAGNSVHRSDPGEKPYSFNIPEKKYTQMQLFMMCGNGNSDVTVVLTYSDGSSEPRKMLVSDWFWEIPKDDKDRFVLIGGLDRIHSDATRYEHRLGGQIFGFNLNPDQNKQLMSISIEHAGGATLDFFGAVGQTVDKAR